MNCSIIRNKETKEIERVNAPNGKESILYKSILDLQSDKEEALKSWAQVYTPSFKEWFGDWEKGEGSKVVDENGEPLLVYHGTDQSFEEFDLKYFGRTDQGDRGYGFYFAPNKKSTEMYGPEIYPVFLNIIKPYVVENGINPERTFNSDYKESTLNEELTEIENDRKKWINRVNNNDIEYAMFIDFEGDKSDKKALLNYVNEDFDREKERKIKYHRALSNVDKADGIMSDYEMVVKSSNQVKSVFNQGTFSQELNNIYQQKEEIPSSKSSEATINKVKEVMKKMGISLQLLSDYLKGNPNVEAKGVNALADLVKGIIAVSEGKEGEALTEEMVHIATAILEQKNPLLISEMINKIERFSIYKRTLNAYKNDVNYQTKDGKPNIRKIKKEAVDKLITELIINGNEGTTEFPELMEETNKSMVRIWWQKILDWFRGEYKKSNISIFEEVAEKVMTGELGAKYYNENKQGVDFVFEQNPELSDIGTPEQYSEYLNSKGITNVGFHHSSDQIEKFKESFPEGYYAKHANHEGAEKAIFFVEEPLKEEFLSQRPHISAWGIKINNPFYYQSKYKTGTEEAKAHSGIREGVVAALKGGNDSVIFGKIWDNKTWSKVLTIFNPNQVIKLGSQEDIQGFKDFIENAPARFKGEGIYFQLSDKQKRIQEEILETQKRIKNVSSDEVDDSILQDTEEANNWYELLKDDGTWERITKRVTDRVKAFYNKTFPHKEFTAEEKALNEIKRDAGIKYHGFFKEIHQMYFNSDGTKVNKIGERPTFKDKKDEEVFMKLEKYFVNLMKTKFTDGKTPLVFSEIKIYDPKAKEAGTLDLLIIDESGKAHILDWKFMNLAPNATDVAWFKKGAFNIQLGRYKEILKDVYGVKEIGMIRAIPILMKMEKKEKKKDSPLYISGITIGSVNPDNIESLTLLPVAEKTESVASVMEDAVFNSLDKLIAKLNAVIEQLGSDKVTTEEDKQFKARRLNILNEAVRSMQIQQDLAPLIEVIKEISKEGQIIIDDYTLNIKDKPMNSITDEQKSKMAADMREYMAIAKVFSKVTVSVGHLIYNNEMVKDAKTEEEKEELKERKQILSDIRMEQDTINRSVEEITELSGEFANKYIGWANRVIDLLLPEKVVKGLAATFKGVSDLPTAALRILYTLTTNAKMTASRTAFEEVEKLMEIREKLKVKGNLRDVIKQIYQKDEKGSLINKLVYRYSKEFFTQVDDNALEGKRDKKWIKDNIDYEAYKKEADEVIARRISWIIKKHSTADEKITEASIANKIKLDDELTDSERLIYKLITDERRMFDIERKDFYGWNNYIIKRHPLDKWISEEYKNIAKDPDLLSLYEFIVKINDHAKDVGYIDNKNKSSFFLPFVRKTMAESFAWDFDISAVKNWGESFTINPSTTGYGSINELTEQVEHSIPRYFTYDFTLEEGKRDTSDLSEDLFKNMIAYITHLQKYTYLTKVEDQIKLVKTIEEGKKHLVTNAANIIETEDGKPKEEGGNEENASLFDKFMRGIFYEEKYPVSDTDAAIGTGVTNQIKGLINWIAKKEVYKIDENPSAISMVKTLDAANRAFQLKTLGFEFISGAVNAFGGRIQVATQAGNYFKSSEIDKNATKLIGNRFASDDEREIFIQLVDKFMPLKDDPSYEAMKDAGMSTLTRGSFIDILMVFMRQPEQWLEKSVFLSLLDNMMIIDGKIVSIPEHVRNKYKGKDETGKFYAKSQTEIKKEIEELKNTVSISKVVTLVDGKLSIPGLDINDNNELNRLTRLTRRISRKATGGVSDSDRNQASMSIWLNSMMVFKSWIPKLLATRFDHFQEVSDDFSVIVGEDGTTEGQKYDIGRVRLWWGFMGWNVIKSAQEMYNVLYANEQGLEKLDELYIKYIKQYKERTGKDLKMSREDFIDMVRTNLRNQLKELAVLTSLIGAGLAMGFMKPPDDADKATKNFYRYAQRVVDKFTQELSFFYNPVQFQKLLSGGTFPAIGLATDIERFFRHFFMQTTGLDFSNMELSQEEVYKKAQPIKYLGKMFPVTKSVFTYGAILNAEFAKEYDITIPKEANR